MCYAVMEEPSFKTVLMDPKVSIEAGWDTKMGLDIQRKVLISTFMSVVIYDYLEQLTITNNQIWPLTKF